MSKLLIKKPKQLSAERKSDSHLKSESIRYNQTAASHRSVSTQHKIIRPKEILPNLHIKTHFKAAQEYSILDKHTYNSTLNDENREIERQLQDANFQIQNMARLKISENDSIA